MDKDKLKQMAADPQYIEGIYNYCDRWCERCPFTSRCLNFALSAEEFNDPESHDIRTDAFWKRLESIFALTKEMISDWAEEEGVDFESLQLSEAGDETERHMNEAANHPLAQRARSYATIVDEWFKKNESVLEDKEKQINLLSFFDAENRQKRDELVSLSDALEVLRWYQFQIFVKIVRALSRDPELEDDLSEFPKDSDGSAKVSLLDIDRSIDAWSTLRKCFPGQGDEFLDILLHLDRLRRGIEKEFPDARSFVRPGFDDGRGDELLHTESRANAGVK
ncbi:MAG: hypothetical protein GF350_15420 [Chitinivibrionales bacterium]|nr:hypothetical protein [Chitinivibrionales bacterium]